MDIHITLIVEDALSEAVARAVLYQTGKPYRIANTLNWNKQRIQHTLSNINKASRGFPHLVLTDQDTEQDCPPNQIEKMDSRGCSSQSPLSFRNYGSGIMGDGAQGMFRKVFVRLAKQNSPSPG